MTIEKNQDQSLRKYGGRSGSNSRPLDQQSDSLPIALRGPTTQHVQTLCNMLPRENIV